MTTKTNKQTTQILISAAALSGLPERTCYATKNSEHGLHLSRPGIKSACHPYSKKRKVCGPCLIGAQLKKGKIRAFI